MPVLSSPPVPLIARERKTSLSESPAQLPTPFPAVAPLLDSDALYLPEWVSPNFLSESALETISNEIDRQPELSAENALVRMLAEHQDGSRACLDVDGELLPFIAGFFSSSVVSVVRRRLTELGITELSRNSLATAGKHTFYTYIARRADDTSGEPSGGGSPRYAGGNGASGSHSDGEEHAPDMQIRRPPHPAQKFHNISVRLIPTTSTRAQYAPNEIINRLARQFHHDFHQNSPLLPPAFDTENPNSHVHTTTSLFHVTRSSNLDSFRDVGVSIDITGDPHDLSPRPAFYLCNTVANGVSHVLRYHHSAPGRPDPVMVLTFVVDPMVILGLAPNEDGGTFNAKHLSVPVDERQVGYEARYQEFCAFVRNNWNKVSPIEQQQQVDFVIAPVCERRANNESVKIAASLEEDGPRLVQVAACSLAARHYLNRKIADIAVEVLSP